MTDCPKPCVSSGNCVRDSLLETACDPPRNTQSKAAIQCVEWAITLHISPTIAMPLARIHLFRNCIRGVCHKNRVQVDANRAAHTHLFQCVHRVKEILVVRQLRVQSAVRVHRPHSPPAVWVEASTSRHGYLGEINPGLVDPNGGRASNLQPDELHLAYKTVSSWMAFSRELQVPTLMFALMSVCHVAQNSLCQ